MKPSDLSVETVAKAVGVQPETLWAISREPKRHYRKPRYEQTAGGKVRLIEEPKPHLKHLLRRLHRFLQRSLKWHPNAHGGICRRSCFSSAGQHTGRKFVVQRDVKNCYPSISTEGLRKRLRSLGFRSDVAHLLAGLMTVDGHIPQGSPVSSDALNLYLWNADHAVYSTAGSIGASSSRVYDDFVTSCDSHRHARRLAAFLDRQIVTHALSANERKKRDHGFNPPHRRQRVHNLEVKRKAGVGIPAEQARLALEWAESYVRTARCVSPDTLEIAARKRQKSIGHHGYCRQARFGPARHVRRLIEQGDRLVRRRLLRADVTRKRKWWVISRTRDEPRRLETLWRKRGSDAG